MKSNYGGGGVIYPIEEEMGMLWKSMKVSLDVCAPASAALATPALETLTFPTAWILNNELVLHHKCSSKYLPEQVSFLKVDVQLSLSVAFVQ